MAKIVESEMRQGSSFQECPKRSPQIVRIAWRANDRGENEVGFRPSATGRQSLLTLVGTMTSQRFNNSRRHCNRASAPVSLGWREYKTAFDPLQCVIYTEGSVLEVNVTPA